MRAPRGTQLTCKSWLTEAAYRMIQNNLDPEVAERPADRSGSGNRSSTSPPWNEGGGALWEPLRTKTVVVIAYPSNW